MNIAEFLYKSVTKCHQEHINNYLHYFYEDGDYNGFDDIHDDASVKKDDYHYHCCYCCNSHYRYLYRYFYRYQYRYCHHYHCHCHDHGYYNYHHRYHHYHYHYYHIDMEKLPLAELDITIPSHANEYPNSMGPTWVLSAPCGLMLAP